MSAQDDTCRARAMPHIVDNSLKEELTIRASLFHVSELEM